MSPRILDPWHFSSLKRMAQSPAHYLHGLTTPHVDTPAMRLGRAVHAYVLGTTPPLVFAGDRRGKAWDTFREEAEPGRDIITTAECSKAHRMCEAVMSHHEAVALLAGTREQEIKWQYMHRDVSSRPDVFTAAHVTELKTSQTADPSRFTALALRMAYHAQLEFYREAVLHSTGGKPLAAFIVAVESSAPYPVTVLRLSARALDQGARLVRSWAERVLAHEAADHWPGYVEGVIELDTTEDVELTYGDEAEGA